jgi:ribosomal protein S18 acetylase RimI-like enzyme
MPKGSVRVRAATTADLPSLVALGEELREQLLPAADSGAGRGRGATSPAGRAVLEQRYRVALEDPDRHLVVAVDDADQPVAAALLTVGPANALLDLPAVHLSHAVVADRHRRRGAGRALVAAAAAFAEERGIEQIVASVSPGSREANRFFARLGFAPLAVRRAAPVQVVRRRLAASESRPAEHVVRRRSLRSRGVPAVPPPVVPLGLPVQEETVVEQPLLP